MDNGSANYGGIVGYLTDVGAYTAKPSDSAYGTFDQGGNAWEWNEADILGDGAYRGLRGGSYGDQDNSLRPPYRNETYDPTNEGSSVGFRVATFADCNGNGIPDECDIDCGATVGMTGALCSDVYPDPACGGSTDDNGNDVPDDCDPVIPTVSTWGMFAMTLLVLAAGTVVFRRMTRLAA